MKKKIILLLLALFPILFLCFTENAKAEGNYVYLLFFKTDRQEYYTDQVIVVNTSWNLAYETYKSSYLQIQIFNETGNKIWNSIYYSDRNPVPEAPFNVVHYIPIRDLYIPPNVSEYVLHVKLLYMLDYSEQYKADVPITIIKRNCSCELFNFKNNIDVDINNYIIFSATFYNETKFLGNQGVNIKINNISISKLTNTNGSIELELKFPNNLTLGINILILEIKNDKFLCQRTFEYEIIVNRHSSLINISNNDINKEEKDVNEDLMFKFNAFSFSLIFFISILIMLTIYYNNNKKIKQQKIADITFRN